MTGDRGSIMWIGSRRDRVPGRANSHLEKNTASFIAASEIDRLSTCVYIASKNSCYSCSTRRKVIETLAHAPPI